MATAPISRKLNLTRDQLAAFLTDQQQIRQFELLFSTVDQLQVITGTDFEFQADNAAANANNALAQISALAQALELLALAPRQELGTIASQNSDNVNITGGLISGLDAPLPIASGGTNGSSTPTAGAVPYGTGIAYAFTAAGTAGQVLTSNGAGVPTWTTPTTGTVTAVSVVSANGFAGTSSGGTTPALTLSTTITGILKGNGTAISAAIANTDYQGVAAPVTKTADFTVANGEIWYINNKTGSTCTVTLPAASSWSGRQLSFKNLQAQTLVSASSNVVPIDSTSAGTAILLGVVGNWATMVSDGTNWVIMQTAPNNILLLE
jgi:hypothetical protein